MKIYVSHSRQFDFLNELYVPIRKSHMNAGRDFFLPHEDGREANNKQIITTSDLMIAEVSFSSTGQGIEMGWANLSGVPIICMYKKGSKVSGWLKDVSDSVIEYSDSADMIGKIEDFISKANF